MRPRRPAAGRRWSSCRCRSSAPLAAGWPGRAASGACGASMPGESPRRWRSWSPFHRRRATGWSSPRRCVRPAARRSGRGCGLLREPDAHPAAHGADGAAQHALSGDGVPGGLPAAACRRARSGGRPGRPRAGAVLASLLPRRALPRAGHLAPARVAAGSVAPRKRRPLPRDRRRRRAVPAGARPQAGDAHRPPKVPARGAPLPAARARTRRGGCGRPAGRRLPRAAGCHRAKHLASLYVDDVADAIRDGIDPRFELSRYAEKLATSAASFDPLAAALVGPPTLVDEITDAIGAELCARHRPDVVGISAPFPGNVYGAFRLARAIRRARPAARLILGGGYVNTELRELSEPRVFDSFDYVTLDDGERPLLSLLRHLRQLRDDGTTTRPSPLHRTFVRENGRVVLKTDASARDIPHTETGTPTYVGLPLDRYVSLFEMLNPMHRLWSDGRWNKLTLAHGCYWKKCTFCDVSLPYIGRYEAATADLIVDRVEQLVAETGERGFHFVDEAAPPAMLRALSQRLLERGVAITWWGNIRFEKTFTPDLCELMARAGCIAVTGGLEVASNRLLALMQKGVTVEQVARVTRAFTDAGDRKS